MMRILATKRSTTHRCEPETTFPAAVLFLSIAAVSPADRLLGGEPTRIQVQRIAGHRAAIKRGIGVVKEFIEIGAPVTSLRRRPALRRLLAYLKRHPDIRYVIFPSRGRFAKELAHARLLYGHFQRLGVGIVLISE